MLKTKPYNACAITCFASHIFQSRYLNQLLTNRLHYGILPIHGQTYWVLPICTVISGIDMSGNKETGKVKYVTKPSIKQAVNAINTAIGRCIRNFIICVRSVGF